MRIARQLAPAGRVFEDSDGEEERAEEGRARPHEVGDGPPEELVPLPRWRSAEPCDACGSEASQASSTVDSSRGSSGRHEVRPAVAARRKDGMSGAHAPAATAQERPEVGAEWRRTVVLQRIPAMVGERAVRRALDELGYAGRYVAFHAPWKQWSETAPWNAFVDFARAEDAARLVRAAVGTRTRRGALAGVCCGVDFAHRQFAVLGDEAKARPRPPRRAPAPLRKHLLRL